MIRTNARVPKLGRHASGQAVVRLGGKDFYLGRFGTPEAQAQYDTLIAEWPSRGRTLPQAQDAELSVNELVLAYVAITLRVKTEKKEDATEGDDAKKPDDLDKLSKAEKHITAELDKQTELAFDDTPLTDVVTFLADYHNIPIIIDAEALTKAGIATDTPVTRTLTGVKLRSALKVILQPLNLGYVIEDDVLKQGIRS